MDAVPGALVLCAIAIGLASAYSAVRGIINYMRRREADRQEMLDLMREQNRRSNE